MRRRTPYWATMESAFLPIAVGYVAYGEKLTTESILSVHPWHAPFAAPLRMTRGTTHTLGDSLRLAVFMPGLCA